MRRGVLILLVVISVTYVSNGVETIHVDDDGPADFNNIQAAIDDANNGDIVIVAEGIYTGNGNYNIDYKGKTITVRSTDPNDPNVVANTIIDPNKAGRGFIFENGEDANCVVSGLTIRNGNTSDNGGGVFCENSSPQIKNSVIFGNSADLYGGGIFCNLSNSEILNCTISGNTAQDGGGIECWSGQPTIVNCVIVDNIALGNYNGGGGVDCFNSGNAILRNCTIAGNLAFFSSGGGILCVDSDVEIENGICWGNNAQHGSQIAVPSWFGIPASISVRYSDVQGGSGAVDVGLQSTLNWDSGNIDAEPNFAYFDPNGDPNLWDFHLQSSYGRWDPNSKNWVADSNTSLCIDVGDPNSDWSKEPWPNGKRINMGAYGGTVQASKNGNPGDFDIDGDVDFEDFCELADIWLKEGSFIEDLFNNGVIDFADLYKFTEEWLWQKD